MASGNGVQPGGIYDATTRPCDTGKRFTAEPDVLVELVFIDGPEGEELHAIQAGVIRRILTRLAEMYQDTKEEGL